MRNWSVGHRPSPGVVVGIIALVAALGGAAVAQPVAKKPVTKKKVKKIANKQITKRAPGLSVASAANADNATNAANADAVDGHSAACPAGTFLQNGVCFDTNVRLPMTPWTSAIREDCADVGGYLPSVSELNSIRDVAGINLGTTGAGHWADDRSSTTEAVTVIDSGVTEVEALAAGQPIRCAFPLVR